MKIRQRLNSKQISPKTCPCNPGKILLKLANAADRPMSTQKGLKYIPLVLEGSAKHQLDHKN